jgi:hypothetical protein
MGQTNYDAQRRFESEAEAAGIEQPIIRLVIRAMEAHDRAAEQINSHAATIVDRVLRTVKHADEGLHLNSNGELQSVSLSFDIAVALYESTGDALRSAASILPTDLAAFAFGGE